MATALDRCAKWLETFSGRAKPCTLRAAGGGFKGAGCVWLGALVVMLGGCGPSQVAESPEPVEVSDRPRQIEKHEENEQPELGNEVEGTEEIDVVEDEVEVLDPESPAAPGDDERAEPSIDPPLAVIPNADVPPQANEVRASTDVSIADPGNLTSVGSIGGRAFQGRSHRDAMIKHRGGTAESEQAVERALKWLAEHQLPDGSWSFDHTGGRCGGRCTHPGSYEDGRLAATGLALLPFLGAGHTHRKGEYSPHVKQGLEYLVNQVKADPEKGGALNHDQGRMYGHGICAIALCEAYGMTGDRWLHDPAQSVLKFISYAQDPAGGGWRYTPRQPGDTSVFSWQFMALKTGHMAHLQVDPNTVKGAWSFLNGVQSDDGAAYGYLKPGDGPATTAIGLLSRMHLGWQRDNPAFKRGAKRLSELGPSRDNLYCNYYATQVMAHAEGEAWEKWNPRMRDYLGAQQSREGHSTGSWHFCGEHSEPGGRLYETALAAMILEVYYRHMPIYRGRADVDEFPD